MPGTAVSGMPAVEPAQWPGSPGHLAAVWWGGPAGGASLGAATVKSASPG